MPSQIYKRFIHILSEKVSFNVRERGFALIGTQARAKARVYYQKLLDISVALVAFLTR
jgi:hypothetical protein